MDEVTLTLHEERAARIVVGSGALSKLPELVAGLDPLNVLVLADPGVPGGLVNDVISGLVERGLRASASTVGGGEGVKTIRSVERIWRLMAASGLTRRSLVVAVGGGSLLDASGFAASTYMRGVRLAYVPTTTLAQADAAVGGKNAVDIDGWKNLVGTFYHPDIVVIDPTILASLPHRIFVDGFSEVVKHAALRGAGRVSWLLTIAEAVRARDERVLDQVIRFSVMTKVDVIRRDYKERGVRALLNFGHTVGHAIEVVSGYRVSHGAAVAAGLVAEASLATKVLGMPEDEVSLLASALTELGLPTSVGYPPERLVSAMRLDKKFLNGKPRIPLPRRLGDFEIVELDWEVIGDWLTELAR